VAIPDYQTIMLPMLQILADGRAWSIQDLTRAVSDHFGLTPEEREERLPSGKHQVVVNRASWSRMYLRIAGLVEDPKRGQVRITGQGRSILAEAPERIDIQLLKRFQSYRDHLSAKAKLAFESEATPPVTTGIVEEQTPNDLIESAHQSLRRATADDLLSRLKSCSSSFFEHIVLRLLMAMGYGGVAGSGSVTGKSGDGGIDGVIRQDKLGLDVVCIQAKRWEAPVGRPVVQQFVGGMDGHRAKKGVILTTSSFTKEAADFLHKIEGKRVVLVDGVRLAELMIDHDLGVTTASVYVVKEVSNDFFDEDEI